jgi:hypothetical protein
MNYKDHRKLSILNMWIWFYIYRILVWHLVMFLIKEKGGSHCILMNVDLFVAVTVILILLAGD